ncbi:hypothetical protein GCK72_017264 [Caenorhabditis remanei]|uniref:Seven TM Receptor n=1 Tax=Caenorhabditis remanei TaxID=31234 RepID=A0A6A5G7F5_CAERE|nr:hypothetical protein GCK72_017264 [Caenorhabditis remanei]KAF1750713.1 hypothetical protein GCK72_017264 [Caenorhabditis remanei]
MEEYGLTMEHVCYNGPIYYICDKDNQCRRDPYIWAVSIFIQASCFGCLLLMSSFGYLTYTRLNTSYINLSVHTCQIQHQLLTALLIQAGIPIIFMYIPIAVLFTSPMFGIGFGVYQNITMACLAIYPPLDQLATICIDCSKIGSGANPNDFGVGKSLKDLALFSEYPLFLE